MANGNGNDTPKWEDTVEIQDAPSWDETQEISEPQGTGFEEAFNDPSVRALEESGASLYDVLAQADAVSTPFPEQSKPEVTPYENIQNALSNLPLTAEMGAQQSGMLLSKLMESLDEAMGMESAAATEDIAQMVGTERIGELKSQMKPTIGIVSAFKHGDPELLISSILASSVDVVRSAVEGGASGGILPVAEIIGSSYTEATEEKARALGIAPEILILQDEEDIAVPLAIGSVGGMLEKVGLKGVSKTLFKNLPTDQVARSLIGSSTKEGLTEWFQFGLEEVNKSLAAAEDDSSVDIGQVFSDAIYSEEGLNSLAAGVAGSGVVGGTSQAIRKTLNKTAQGEEVSDQELNTALADGDAEVAQNVKDVTEGLQELSEEAGSTVEQDQISESDQEQQIEAGTEVELEVPEEARILALQDEDAMMDRIAANSLETFEQQAEQEAEQASLDPDAISQEVDRDESLQRANNLLESTIKRDLESINPENLKGKSKKAYQELQKTLVEGTPEQKQLAMEKFAVAKSEETFTELKPKIDRGFGGMKELYRRGVQEVGNIRTYTNLITGFDTRVGSRVLEAMGLGNLVRSELEYTDRTNKGINGFQKVVDDNQATWEDAVKVSIFGHLMGRYSNKTEEGNVEIQENADNLYKSARRKLEKGEKNAQREIELIDEAIDRFNKGGQILDTDASKALMDYVKTFNNEHYGDINLKYKTYFGKDIPYVYDYVPRRATGFHKLEPKSVAADLMNELQQTPNKAPKPKVYESDFSFDRNKDIGNATYELDITKVFPDHVKSVVFDSQTIPAFSLAANVLSSKGASQALGKENTKAFTEYLRGYVAMTRGRRMSTPLKAFNKIKNQYTAAILGMPDQLVKQGLPAILQTGISNPVQSARAISALSQVNDEWFGIVAPELLLRKKEISRFQEEKGDERIKLKGKASRKVKKAAQNANNWAIQMGDNFAARLVFMTDLMERSKDQTIEEVIQNPDPAKVRDAIGTQESLQNVSSVAFAGNLFTSPDQTRMWLSKSLFALTNFALNQSLNLVNSIAASGKSKDARRIAVQAAIGALSYPAITVAIAEAYDEIFDSLAEGITGEEEEKEKIEGLLDKDLYDKMGRAVISRGLFDATLGTVPLLDAATGASARLEEANKAMVGKDYSYEDKLFYDDDVLDLFGPAGGYFDIVRQGTSNAIDAANAEDDDKAKDLATLSGIEFLRAASVGMSGSGLINRITKEFENYFKGEVFDSNKSKKGKSLKDSRSTKRSLKRTTENKRTL